MPNVLTPVGPPYYIGLPNDWMAWLGWVLLCAVLIWGTVRARSSGRPWGKREWLLLGGLVLATLALNTFLGVRLSAAGALSPPGRPEEPRGPVMLFLGAAPWMLAAGLLGPVPAIGLAVLAGLTLGLSDTHTLFTPVVTGLLALVFSLAIRQRYRTLGFRLLRFPLFSAGLVGLAYLPLFLLGISFETPGASLVARLDYGLSHLGSAALAMGGTLILGGAITQIMALVFPSYWGENSSLLPSPGESSLQLRFFYGTAPLVLILLSTLMVGDWFVAGNAARSMLRDRLSSTAQLAAESIPFFLESGQNLVVQIAGDARLATASVDEIQGVLHDQLTSIPFFRQLYLVDANGEMVTGYPGSDADRLQISAEEQSGIQLAFQGIPVQTYTIPPQRGEATARVSFIAAVKDSGGQVVRALIGRADLASNPFTKPIIQSFETMKAQGENGMIVDENGRILYHPVVSWLMTPYRGRTAVQADFFDETGSDGTRSLVYYQPTAGRSWAIVLSVPAQRAQQMALNIAVPLLVMILFIAILAFVSLRLGLRMVTGSLLGLAGEAGRIAQGQLDHSLPSQGVDEVGQLRQAFEQMRMRLKARLDELNRLLAVSQGVASSLEIDDAIQPILNAALNPEACSVRVVIAGEEGPGGQTDYPRGLGIGPASLDYAYLDDQILALCRTHSRLVLSNLTRGKGLTFLSGTRRPAAILGVALHHEAQYYGALWVGYDHPHAFTEDEVSFLTTLAGEAALAAANDRLFTTAEVGRQRLEAILASTPDPVFVTDEQEHLLLTNPAALQIPGLMSGPVKGSPISAVIGQRELLDLFHANSDEQAAREVTLLNGRTYYASISSVAVGDQPVGKVCVLRDITHFKEVDTLKSDFVATVSHDLRSPLTLMRGYATMLQMVGELNEQQRSYVRKIVTGVESMSRLVNNLLDLGRIEAGVGLQLETIPVAEIVERVTSSLQLQAAQKNIQLKRIFPPDGAPVIEADQALLQQALYNLVENGIKYTPLGGEVSVQVQEKPGSVIFEIRDTGIGIAPIDQPRLFEKFYRSGQREGGQARGSGLGLAIVKSIAERHGGKVWLESYLGRGSTFHLEIPVKPSQRPGNGSIRQGERTAA